MKTIKLGTLYMNGQPVLFNTSTPVQYINNSILELKSSYSDVNYQVEWLVIEDGAKNYLLSTRNILSNISYNMLNIQTLTTGNTVITLGGTKYKLRLITNDEWNKYVLNQINLNSLLTPTLLDMTVNGYDDSTISSSETNNLLHWYKSKSLTQTFSDTDNLILRGGTSIDSSSIIGKDELSNYRIMLEKYNTPPTISGTDTTLGSFSTNFTKSFSVIDPDNDLFTIITMVDDITIQTLTNQLSKTDFTISLENQWNSLSEGRHTIYINVNDSYGNFVQRKWIFNKLGSESGTSNALVRPIITTDTSSSSTMTPVDGRNDNTFKFTAIGGELVVAHEFSIVDSETQVEIYKRKIESFIFEHTVPSNTMTNGKIYQLKVRTYNQTGQYSGWSDIVLIRALTPVELMINTIINQRIETGNPFFTASANFIVSEGDELYLYEYNLYKDGVRIATSNELSDKALSYQFTNLENKTYYTIELIVKTNYGMTVTLSQEFYCIYLQARLPAIMELINDSKAGTVTIDTYVRQIIGRVYSGDDVYYIDNDWAYLHNTTLIYDKDGAFRLNGSWTAKIWARDLEDDNTMLLQFNLDDGSIITLTRWENMFTLSKVVSGIRLYELRAYIQGEILSTDVFYFFIQNDVDLGLMNFDVKRVTEGRLSWFEKTYINDIAPNYQSEDGFLTNINPKLLNNIVPKTIDGQDSMIYLPSMDDFELDVFKSILPEENTESEYNIKQSDITIAKIGTAKVGQFKVYKSSYLTGISIFTRNLYTDNEPLKIKYKIHSMDNNSVNIVEMIDNEVINTINDVVIDNDYIIDLTSSWDTLKKGNHTVYIKATSSTYTFTKELNFIKGYTVHGLSFDDSKIETITRSIDANSNNKLISIGENNLTNSIYPIQKTGIRIMFDLPLTTKVSLYKDNTDDCFNIITQINTLFTTQLIGNLNIGDQLKEFSTRYNNKLLRFTIINKLNDRVILMCDNSICEKNFDEAESVFVNGNPDWNLSNIKQWLNNNIKIG